MGDRRVSEHPLDIGLVNGNHVADDHGQDRQNPEHAGPVWLQFVQTNDQDSHKRCKRRSFRSGTHEGGNRGRCPLIDIRGPHVKRCGANFEQETDREQHQTGNRHRVTDQGRIGNEHFLNFNQLGRAGHAVDQGDPVEQKSGRKGAEQKILHAGFIRFELTAEHSGQHIEGDRQNFQAEENRHQVDARGHEHGTDRGEQDQRVVLADRISLALQVIVRHQDRQAGCDQKREVKEGRVVIQCDVTGKTE